MLLQDVIKLPKLQSHVSLMGRRTSKLPDTGTVIVQGHRQKPYPVKLTSKTKYNWKELVFEGDAKFTATIDTDSQPWTVYSIQKLHETCYTPEELAERVEQQREEMRECGGDY